MNDTALFIAISFGTFRLARLIAFEEEGPFGAGRWIADRIRKMGDSWVKRGLTCMMCLSFWISLALCLVARVGGGIDNWSLFANAIASLIVTLLWIPFSVYAENTNPRSFILKSVYPATLLGLSLLFLLLSFEDPTRLLIFWLGTAGVSAWISS